MDKKLELEIVRRAYAKHLMAAINCDDKPLESAFAETPREEFLGPGPWQALRGPGLYTPTPSDDPVYLYTDMLFAIVPSRGLNNGQPSMHAALLRASAIVHGQHVVHVGAGTGYFTAIMARLVGPSGRVTAIEFDPDLAERARQNLGSFQNVRVLQANGAAADFDTADVIYVNAGVTRPAETWLERLNDGGRLILPLTTDASLQASSSGQFEVAQMAKRGAVFRIQRRETDFDARWLFPAAYILAEGVRDSESEAALANAFQVGDPKKVTRLYRTDDLPSERCWLQGRGWCLAYS